jgi:hypothetical protein
MPSITIFQGIKYGAENIIKDYLTWFGALSCMGVSAQIVHGKCHYCSDGQMVALGDNSPFFN